MGLGGWAAFGGPWGPTPRGLWAKLFTLRAKMKKANYAEGTLLWQQLNGEFEVEVEVEGCCCSACIIDMA